MGQENRDILNFLISMGLAGVEVTGGADATNSSRVLISSGLSRLANF